MVNASGNHWQSDGVDPKFPFWDGSQAAQGLERYKNRIEMHILTIDDDGNAEKKARLLKALAPKLWANLRNEAAECVKDMKPSDLTGDGRRGVDAILAALGKRFPEHTNRKLPRV